MGEPLAEGIETAPPDREADGADGLALRILRGTGRALLGAPRFVAWLPPLALATLIFYLSSLDPSFDSVLFPLLEAYLANLAHPGIFGLLAVLLVPVLPRTQSPDGARWTALTPQAALWVVVLVGLYGFTDELHQSVVDGRDASLFDLASDVVGAFFAVAVILYLGRPDANERGLRRWLAAGFFAACLAAGASTIYGQSVGEGPWPF